MKKVLRIIVISLIVGVFTLVSIKFAKKFVKIVPLDGNEDEVFGA